MRVWTGSNSARMQRSKEFESEEIQKRVSFSKSLACVNLPTTGSVALCGIKTSISFCGCTSHSLTEVIRKTCHRFIHYHRPDLDLVWQTAGYLSRSYRAHLSLILKIGSWMLSCRLAKQRKVDREVCICMKRCFGRKVEH